MSRKRAAWIVLGSAATVVVLALIAAVVVVRSAWFHSKVRERLVAIVESATGGRVEIGGFRFDWRRLRVEVTDFTVHGSEPPDKPPLLHAASIEVGLKIVSVLERDVDIEHLDVGSPSVYLIISPDGRTNVPEPKVPRKNKSVVESILDLRVSRFSIQKGVFAVESRGKTPFDARGRNLGVTFLYDFSGPRYRGHVRVQPLDVKWNGLESLPLGLTASLAIERNRLAVTSAKLVTGDSHIEISGTVEDLASPHGAFQYDARVSVPDAGRVLRVRSLERGAVEVGGKVDWAGGSNYSISGKWRAHDLEFRDSDVRLLGFRADGAMSARPEGVDLSGLRIWGAVRSVAATTPVEGRIAIVSVRGRRLEARGIGLEALGGAFEGEAQLGSFENFSVSGEIRDIAARSAVALYSSERLPWDGRVAGSVQVEGSLHRRNGLRAVVNLAISPAGAGPPVHGSVSATYDAGTGLLDLGHSTITLPSSRADVSGVIGRELKLHLETRDLNDFLPALGESAAELPAGLRMGALLFNGTVTGKLADPKVAGHLSAMDVSYDGRTFNSVEASVSVGSTALRVQNATATRGRLRVQGEASVGLRAWKAPPESPVAATATLRNAALADLAELLNAKDLPASGTLNTNARITGTVGNPLIQADVDVVHGTVREEPFDRLTARVNYSSRTIEVAAGELSAGPVQLRGSAAFEHAAASFDTGRLRFQVDSNTMPLEDIRAFAKSHPGVKGTVQLTAGGDIELVPPGKQGLERFRIRELHGDLAARGLRLSGQSVGDAHLEARSQGPVLETRLEAGFAGSNIQGSGQWRLEGDYPGSAVITFSRLDFAQLRDWLAPAQAADRFAGFAEGQLRVEGPALKPELLKAELRLPKVEIGPSPAAGIAAAPLTLHNEGAIVVTAANSVVTLESARLVSRATDLSVSGKILLQQKNALDLRVNGRVDLAVVQDFNRDFTASGTVSADAAVRGTLVAPQVAGRMEFQKATFNLADFPNAIANANGVVTFAGDRATIQTFTGETGGGTIRLTGFGAYEGGQPVFRLHARAEQVRVRYPEGVSTVADASLNLTGTLDSSMLSGNVTILRTAFNPESDFSSLIAKSAEPVRTPSSPTGFLGGLNFDVQIDTSPDIQFQSTLTQDVQMEANLRLRGNVSNPALLGRINMTQGRVFFFGTKYNLSQGTIAFYNPVKVEPILNLDLDTRARGIDITITVSGPLTKLSLTPRSDPPLQFSEIVALLATGRAPTSDPTLLARQSSTPQSWQQMGASALLGQAIAAPVAGRLQRFFGVSNLRIDPTLPSAINTSQARLTLEQQVTPDVTFTYITDVTSSNPQVVRVEWAFSKQWSVVALREENGLFGMDFFYRRRF